MYPSDVCSNNHKTLYRSISQETRSKKKYDYWIFIDFIFLMCSHADVHFVVFFFFLFFCSLGETLFSKVFLIQGVRISIRSVLFVSLTIRISTSNGRAGNFIYRCRNCYCCNGILLRLFFFV